MSSIDERIVEMKFRRDDFLKGTNETLNALERLEQNLGGGGAIATGVNKIQGALGAFGAIGTGALMRIGGAAVDAGLKLVKNVIDPIFTGGKKRALNLEQANFQLEGILKNSDDVAAVMKNVSDAVDGTAYGLDAAAIAAAQFAASGMRAGDDMANALKGISGVAAMAGSSYEDVSSIFTKVAGQGRLMGDDLNRLASRGINAAASMVDYYKSIGKFADITEADLREMVSKGQISFADFADAMNSAFGEHATKANETYAGSLSNIKAALARIGANYYTAEHEKLRRSFNAMRPVINLLNKALQPMIARYNQMFQIPFAETMERWGASMEKWNQWENLGRVFQSFIFIAANFRDVVASWVRPVVDAFNAVFPASVNPESSWVYKIMMFLSDFNRAVFDLKASEGQANVVREAFTKFFEVLKGFGDIIKTVFGAAEPILQKVWDAFKVGLEYVKEGFEWARPYVEEFFEYLFGQEGKITTFFRNLRSEIEDSGGSFQYLKTQGQEFYTKYIEPMIESLTLFKEALLSIKTDGLEGFGKKIEEAFGPLEPAWIWVKDTWKALREFQTSMFDPIGWIKDQLPSLGEGLEMFFTWLSDNLPSIGEDIGDGFSSIMTALGNFGTTIKDLLSEVTPEQMDTFLTWMYKLLVLFRAWQTLKSLEGMFDQIGGFFGTMTGTITSFNDRLKESTRSSSFLKIAVGIGIIAGALWLLAQVDMGKLWGAALVLGFLAGVIVSVMVALSLVDGKTLAGSAFGMTLFASALFGMAITMALLGLIPYDIIVQGMTVLLILVAAMVGAGILLAKFAPQLNIAAFGMLIMAFALMALYIPIKMFGEMDLVVLAQGMFAVVFALGALSLAAIAIGANGMSMLLGAVGMLAMAFALQMLVDPIMALGYMPYDNMMQGLIGLGVALLLLVAAATGAQGVALGAIALAVLAVSMLALAFAIEKLASIPMASAAGGIMILATALGVLLLAALAAGAILPGVLALAGLLLAFGVAALLVGLGMVIFAAGAALLAAVLPSLATGFVMLAPAIALIGEQSGALVVFTLAVGALGAAALLFGASIVALGVGLTLMGLGMALITPLADPAAAALMAFVEAIGPLIWQVPKILGISTALAALGAALVILGLGMAATAIGAAALGIAAIIFGVGIAAMITLGALVSPLADQMANAFRRLSESAPYVLAFVAMMHLFTSTLNQLNSEMVNLVRSAGDLADTITDAATQFSVAAEMARSLSIAFESSMTQVGNAMKSATDIVQERSQAMSQAFVLLKAGIDNNAPKIATAVEKMSDEVSKALDKGASNVTEKNSKISDAFLVLNLAILTHSSLIQITVTTLVDGMVDKLTDGEKKIKTKIDAVVKQFDALAKGIGDHKSSVKTAAESLITAAASGLRTNLSRTIDIAASVGLQIAQGMASGIRSGGSLVSTAANNVAKNAMNGAKTTLGIKSPSREFYAIGQFAVQGLSNALNDGASGVANTTEDLATAMLRALDASFDDSMRDFEWEAIGFHPTITPIVDLSQARQTMRGFDSGFAAVDHNSSQADMLARMDLALSRGMGSQSADDKGVTFIQNNTSPKALSSIEIYRRTKNMLSVYNNDIQFHSKGGGENA